MSMLRLSTISRRALHTTRTARAEGGFDFVNGDSTGKMVQIYHKINVGLLAATPLALFVGGPLQMPLDLALGVMLPIHGHIGMNMVITDYAKKIAGKGAVGPARMGMAVLTGTTMLGLLKLNLAGPGITESVKSFWRPNA